MARRRRPKVAVWKFASCDGCQLTLLNCEEELLAVAGEVEIAYFLEASRAVVRGPYDLSLVEGSISTPHDAARIQQVRRVSRVLVTIGACATAGGIQALRNFADVEAWRALVYAHPDYVETLATSTPVAAHVAVDFELRGCPINKGQLVEVLTAFLHGRPTGHPHRQRVPGVQAPGDGVCHGRRRDAVPGADHSGRLRRDLSCLPARVLRLLWPDGDAQRHRPGRLVEAPGGAGRRHRARAAHLQRLGRTLPHGERAP